METCLARNLILVTLFLEGTTIGVNYNFSQIITLPPLNPSEKCKIDLSDYVNSTQEFDNIDIFWKSLQSIQIHVLNFSLDTFNGDFLLLSDYPLNKVTIPMAVDPSSPMEGHDMEFEGRNLSIPINGEDTPPGSYVLLTSKIIGNRTFGLYNPAGVYFYFHHGGGRTQDYPVQLVLELTLIDEEESATTEGPPDEPTLSPPNGDNAFITRVVTGKDPFQFIKELPIFKKILANLTSTYCVEKGIELPLDPNENNVYIPLTNIVHCSRGHPGYFNSCVEVNFAIVVYDPAGVYVMTIGRIEEMLKLYGEDLKNEGYCLAVPSGRVIHEDAKSWLIMGIGLCLTLTSVLLCITCLGGSFRLKINSMIMVRSHSSSSQFQHQRLTDKGSQRDDPFQQSSDLHFFDRKNPVSRLLKRMKREGPNNYKSKSNVSPEQFGYFDNSGFVE